MRARRNLRNIVFFTVIATALLPLATAQQAPATSDWRNGRIAFSGCGDIGCDIYTVNPDGTALHQVTHNGSSFQPDWSPDATHIAYASTVSGFLSIWVADADGGNARQLTPDDPTSANLWPHFMPDGRTVLYTNCFGDGCDGGISAIDIDGTNPRVITPNIGVPTTMRWPSPDGKRLAFMKWHVKGIMMGIYLLRLGAEPEHPVTTPELEGWAPDWSPDGDKILFSSNIFSNRPNGAIYSIRPDGQDLQQLTYPKFPLEDWSAAYSPNGARIVFASDRRYPDRCCSDLFTMRADESDGHNDAEGEQRRLIRRIPMPLYATDPRWGIAPLLTEATTNVSAATVNPGAVPPGRAAAMRNVCRAFPCSLVLRSAISEKTKCAGAEGQRTGPLFPTAPP